MQFVCGEHFERSKSSRVIEDARPPAGGLSSKIFLKIPALVILVNRAF